MTGSNPQMIVRIAANLVELKKNLAEGKDQIETTTAAMSKLASSLDGSKLEQRANNIVAAMNEVGGASKLTTAEAERLLKPLDAWIAKAELVGTQVPADMLKARDSLKGVVDQAEKGGTVFEGLPGQLSKIAGTLGLAFSAGAIISFGKSVFDTASNIHDMSERIGISAEAVQGFKFAAEQAGSTLDAVGTAITKMNSNLDGGDTATVQALKEAGLNFNTIRAMKPEDAFLAIADAIQKMPDPMEQSHVALKLFGKGAAELLPAIKEGFRGASDSALKMSTDTINSLEAAQDAWSKLANAVTIASGTIIAHSMSVGSQISSSWKAFSTFVGDAFTYGTGAAVAMADGIHQVTEETNKSTSAAGSAGIAHGKTGAQIAAEAEAAKKAAEALKHHNEQIEALTDAVTHAKKISELTEALDLLRQKGEPNTAVLRNIAEQATELLKNGGVLSPTLFDLANKFGLIRDPVLELGMKGIPGLTGAFDRLTDAAGSLKVLDEIPDYLNKIGRSTGDVEQTKEALRHTAEEAKRAGVACREIVQSLSALGSIAAGSLGDFLSSLASIAAGLDAARQANAKWGGSAGIASAMFSDEADSSEKWAAAIQSATAIASGAMEVWNATANAGSKAAGALHGAMAGAKAGAAFGPWGAAIGGAAGALVGFIRNMGAGRKAVEDFGKQYGGLDELHQKMLALGDAGEQMWIKLTQHTDKGDLKGAQAQIEAIQAALAKIPPSQAAMAESAGYQTTAQLHKAADDAVKLWQFMKDSGEYTASAVADAWAKAQDAMKNSGDSQVSTIQTSLDAAKSALAGLDSEIASLQASINSEAPEEVMGVVEAQARARLAALQAERDAAASHVEDVQNQLTESLNRVAAAIEDIPHELEINVKTNFSGGGSGSSGGGSSDGEHHYDDGGAQASGGDYIVDRPTTFVAGEAGRERATFRPASRGSMNDSGGDIVIHHQTVLDGKVIDERIKRVSRRDAKAGGLTVPAGSVGRGY